MYGQKQGQIDVKSEIVIQIILALSWNVCVIFPLSQKHPSRFAVSWWEVDESDHQLRVRKIWKTHIVKVRTIAQRDGVAKCPAGVRGGKSLWPWDILNSLDQKLLCCCYCFFTQKILSWHIEFAIYANIIQLKISRHLRSRVYFLDKLWFKKTHCE